MKRIDSSTLLAAAYGRPRLVKNANGWTDAGRLIVDTAGSGVRLLGELANQAAVTTVAAAVLGGGALGWGLSKLTAHDAKDIESARKAFVNERLNSDIGYMKSQLRREAAERGSEDKVKAARIL